MNRLPRFDRCQTRTAPPLPHLQIPPLLRCRNPCAFAQQLRGLCLFVQLALGLPVVHVCPLHPACVWGPVKVRKRLKINKRNRLFNNKATYITIGFRQFGFLFLLWIRVSSATLTRRTTTTAPTGRFPGSCTSAAATTTTSIRVRISGRIVL